MSVKHPLSKSLYEIKFNFRRAGDGIYVFFEPNALPVKKQQLEDLVANCKKNRIDCIIPCLSGISEASGVTFALISDFYRDLLGIAEKRGVHVGLSIDKFIETCLFFEPSIDEKIKRKICSKILNQREYYCSECEHISMDLNDTTVMSVSVFDEENGDSIDIYDSLQNGRVEYVPPVGNWVLNAYTCDYDNIVGGKVRRSVNKLNFEASKRFLSLVLDILGEDVKRHIGKTLTALYMNDICFDSPNRRNWDDSFNDKFMQMFNFDPKPYYDCLFYGVGEHMSHLKTLFMACRSKMLSDGIFKALDCFARENSLEVINGITEPKLADCSWLTGDALLNFSRSSCALLDKEYMYGFNSLNLASSAGESFGLSDTYCELFKNYGNVSPKIMFKDVMCAYSRGCTRLLAHDSFNILLDSKDNPTKKKLLDLNTRCRNMLGEGTRVSDIAILYPIDSMHSEVFLYQTKSQGFEYPNIMQDNDYMTVINLLSYFCGQDTMLIHPSVMKSSCRVSGNKLCMTTGSGENHFSVLVIPGTSVISIDNLRLIKEFYDKGGKIIATGRLPRFATEYHPDHEKAADDLDFMRQNKYGTDLDVEVRETMSYIFGSDTAIQTQVHEYYYNANSNGGEAYFVCSSKTTSDGTLYCDEKLLKRILYSFNIPLDVYMSGLPRHMGYDALGDIYPNFSRLGLGATLPRGGTVNRIHKRRGELDVYFFSNTTDTRHNGYAFIKGSISPVALDPISGKRKNVGHRYVEYKNQVYTAVHLDLEACGCVFILSLGNSVPKRKITNIPKIKSIEHNFLTE